MSRVLAVPVLLAAALAGCTSLPSDDGRSAVAELLEPRGPAFAATGGPQTAESLLAEQSGRPLSATDAVRLALVNNPGLAAEYARLGFTAAEVFEAGRLSNPVLSASLMVPDAGGEANQIGFGLAQSFTDALLLPSRRRFAALEYERARQLVAASVLELAAATEAAHIRVVGAWQLLSMREAIATAAAAGEELAGRMHAAGNINRLELALQQADASEARLEVMQARAGVSVARGELNRLMGFDATEDDWRVAARLPAPLATEEPVAALLQRADASRPDLAAARQHVTQKADVLGVTRSFRLLGEIEVGVETERETDRSRISGPTLALELPIFNQGQGRVARAEAELHEAEAELRALEIDISNGVQRAASEVAVARARAAHYRDSLIPLREAIVARTQEEVNFMLEGQFRLLQVKQQEYAAYQGYLESVRDYWLARVELAREVGTALSANTAEAAPALDAESLIRPRDEGAHPHHPGMQMPATPGKEAPQTPTPHAHGAAS